MRQTLLVACLVIAVVGLATVAAIRVGTRSTGAPIPETSDPAPQTDLNAPADRRGWPYDVQCKDLVRDPDGAITFDGSPGDHPDIHGVKMVSGTEFSVWNEKCLNILRAPE